MRLKSAALILCCGFLLSAIPARAGIYYVTVAGLGGEPDYEQRFTALATDLDDCSRPPERKLTSTRWMATMRLERT